jgi:hypothetical protein
VAAEPYVVVEVLANTYPDTVEVLASTPTITALDIEVPGPAGPPGAPGPTGATGPAGPSGVGYTHTQSTPGTVWVINHELGFNPAGIVVTSVDGFMLDGFGVQYLTTGESLRLSFDLSVAGVAQLS